MSNIDARNTAQMGYDYLGQMTSRKVTLTATPSTESFTISHDGGKRVRYTNLLLGTINRFTDTGKLQEQDNSDGPRRRAKGAG